MNRYGYRFDADYVHVETNYTTLWMGAHWDWITELCGGYHCQPICGRDWQRQRLDCNWVDTFVLGFFKKKAITWRSSDYIVRGGLFLKKPCQIYPVGMGIFMQYCCNITKQHCPNITFWLQIRTDNGGNITVMLNGVRFWNQKVTFRQRCTATLQQCCLNVVCPLGT